MSDPTTNGRPHGPITIYRDWCKRCGLCAAFCPGNVYDRDEQGYPIVARPEDCIKCRLCELRCPDFSITVDDSDSSDTEDAA